MQRQRKTLVDRTEEGSGLAPGPDDRRTTTTRLTPGELTATVLIIAVLLTLANLSFHMGVRTVGPFAGSRAIGAAAAPTPGYGIGCGIAPSDTAAGQRLDRGPGADTEEGCQRASW